MSSPSATQQGDLLANGALDEQGQSHPKFTKVDVAMMGGITRDANNEPCGLLVTIGVAVHLIGGWKYEVTGRGVYGDYLAMKLVSEDKLRKVKCDLRQKVKIQHDGAERYGTVTGIAVRGNDIYYDVKVDLVGIAEDKLDI